MFQSDKNLSVFIPKQSLLFNADKENYEDYDKRDLVYRVKDDRLALIEASAGTGKTFSLVELVLELILVQEIPLKKILIVTFTEKATTELKLRLRKKFHNLLEAFEQKDDSLKKIPKGPFWEIDEKRKNLLKAACLDFDSTQIFTIHGFCKRILSEFAFENRQLFEQEYCDTNFLFQEVFSRYIRRNLLSQKNSVSILFNLYVKHNEGNLETLRHEILSLLNKEGEIVPNLPHFNDFVNDFTECWDAFIFKDKILRRSDLGKHPIITAFEFTALNRTSSEKTFENVKLLLKILDDYNAGAGIYNILPSFFEIVISSITNPKCKKKLQPGEKWLSQKEFPQAECQWLEALNECGILLKRKNIFGGAKKILKAWLLQNVLKEIQMELSKNKLERGFFDFDDLLRIVDEELSSSDKKNIVLSPLTSAIREKYICAIIDEFQDTDRRQWSIFNRLFLESRKHRLILIGDPKQSIYSFRGADIFTYLKAREKIHALTSKSPFFLKKNFRSSEKMIMGLNQIFKGDLWFPENRGIAYQELACGDLNLELKDNTPDRDSIHLLKLTPKFNISAKKIDYYKQLKKPKISLDILNDIGSLSGEIFFSKDDFLKKLNSILGNDIVSKNSADLLNLFLNDQTKNANLRFADAIAIEIKSLLRFGKPKKLRPIWEENNTQRNINENDICVLFRKTNEGELIAKALRKQGVDFVFYKQKGLFSGREAIEILDLLQAIANPSDYSRVGKLWLTRFFEVNLKEISSVDLKDSNIFYQLQEWNSLAEKRKFGKLFDEILKLTKLIERELFLGGDERSVTNYLHLFELLNKQTTEKHLNLLELIQLLKGKIEGKENIGDKGNFLRIESERNAVQLMTMHAAKGLEFPIVFLFGGLTGNKSNSAKFYYDEKKGKKIIDLINSKIPEEHIWQEKAEQQRLLYVAMTRARGRLYLPYISFLSKESKRRICKINGPYSMLNAELSNIMYEKKSNKKQLPFSISIAEISSQTQIKNVFSKKNINICDWFPKELSANPAYLNKKNNLENIFNKLRFEKRGFVVSSFSKLKKKGNEEKLFFRNNELSSLEFRSEEELGQLRENDEIDFDYLKKNLKSDLGLSLKQNEKEILSTSKNPESELSGGIKMGNLMHDLLEKIEFSSIRKSISHEEWLASNLVREFIESFTQNYGYSNTIVSALAEIIWKTLRTKIKLGKDPGSPVLELANIKRELREVDFYFPLPKSKIKADELFFNNHSITEGWKIEKGFLRGSIDFLFEHNGKIYFLDWKSNILDNYHSDKLKEVVLENYELQFQIYTLATCYWFKINIEEKYEEKFGGAIYLFLRGMKNYSIDSEIPSASVTNGVYFKRPSWKEFLEYEKKLFSINF